MDKELARRRVARDAAVDAIAAGLRISSSAASALSAAIPKPSASISLCAASDVGASRSQKSASTS